MLYLQVCHLVTHLTFPGNRSLLTISKLKCSCHNRQSRFNELNQRNTGLFAKMYLPSCHTLLILALVAITMVSWTAAVRAALVDPRDTTSPLYSATSRVQSNKLALRIERLMPTVWLSFVGLLSLAVAAACLSFGGRPRLEDQGKHCKMV